VFRRDVDGGMELVADGDVVRQGDGALLVRGAQNPSISADGRFVAFSTAQRLVPADSDAAGRFVDVYVRDMSVPVCRPLPECGPNPYTLVSARDGGDVPFTYAAPSVPSAAGNSGSEVPRTTGISDDGDTVVLRTVQASDAAGGPTPAAQVLVRRLAAKDTQLVTRVKEGRLDAGTPAGGALGAVALSGDGTAVAWSGRNAERQTRFQPGERQDDNLAFYLWQRVADGGRAPTRRVTGPTDPDDPGCAPSEVVDESDQSGGGPCSGPLAQIEEANAPVFDTSVAMSADGYELAFLTVRRRAGPGSSRARRSTSSRRRWRPA
jgi:hypothetical protein